MSPSSIFESYFANQGFAFFEYLGNGEFLLLGNWPSWSDAWGPWPPARQSIRLGEKSPFLENFLFEAEEYWNAQTPGALNSGNWIERDATGHEIPLEASASLVEGRRVLIVRNLSATFAQQQQVFQTARDFLLEHEKLVKETQKKEILLHCIVHDLTQPLSAMNGVFHLLQREPLPSALQKYVKAGERESQRQELMIRGILDAFSGDLAAQQARDALVTEPPDLLACAKLAVQEFSIPFREHGIRLRIDPRVNVSGNWHVAGDAARLDRIFGNLLENAMRYSPKDSTVTIGLEDQGGFVLASVDDEGPGLPQGQRVDQLFALFAKGKTHSGKAGLGLYFCKITVERWGGAIGAETRNTVGSRFWFRLPRAAAAATAATGAPVAKESAPAGNFNRKKKTDKPLHILVADDAELNRELVIELLKKRGHSAEGAADGHAVLAALQRRDFDVVLMDEEMPRMTGLEATRAIRQQEAETKKHQVIIGLSGHATEEDEHRFQQAGMDACLTKPVSMEKLYRAVESPTQGADKSARSLPADSPQLASAAQPASIQTTPNLPAAKQPAPATAASAPTAHESIDVAAHLRRTTGGNEKLVQSLARSFLSDGPKMLARLRAAIARKNTADLASSAHLLKGSLAIFGAPQAVAAARDLEAQGRAQNLRESAPSSAALESEFAKLLRDLRAIHSAPKPKTKSGSKTKAKSKPARKSTRAKR